MSCGVVTAESQYHVHGIVGGALGFVVGLGVAVYASWAPLLIIMLLFFPMPPCRSGRSRTIFGYQWNPMNIFGYTGKGVFLYRCRCGDTYIRIGRRVVNIEIEGKVSPYKELKGFYTWIDRTSEEE